MYYFCFIVLLYAVTAANVSHYDTFTGKIISEEEYNRHVKENSTYWCTGEFQECDPNEGRRLDLTCSNLEFPTRGTSHSPYLRDLPALFGPDYGPVKKKNGKDMEPARKVRVEALAEADIPDQHFSANLAHMLLFTLGTQTSFHDTINFMVWTPNCCQPSGKNESMCYPHKILPNDIVHRLTGLTCMNQTKPFTFQHFGCLKDKNEKPQRINSATNYFDLNLVYSLDNQLRSFENGKLLVDVENGRTWPVPAPKGQGNCLQNEPGETRCHKTGGMNGLIGMNMYGIIFWREHNFIAEQLKQVNPSWDDNKLFTIAREINIAYFTQIFYYELLSELMGKENLINDGILSADGGFRKQFKKGLQPQVSIEFIYAMRWGHTIMPGVIKMYNKTGSYMGEVESPRLTLRTGFLGLGDNFEYMLHGSYKQGAGQVDHAVDPVISEKGLGNLQYAFDLTMADLAKAGLHGIANYASFRKLCTGKEYNSFDDLAEDVEPQYIEIMKQSHEDVSDVPLLLGIWLEKAIPGGYAPRTLYCIASRQYKRFMQYDRHWYEDPDRPNAFTSAQLAEVRKFTLARLLCDSGHTIDRITPHALLREGPGNEITDCKNIPQVDYSVWKEC